MNAADRASGTSQVVNTHTFSFDHVQQGRQHEDDEFQSWWEQFSVIDFIIWKNVMAIDGEINFIFFYSLRDVSWVQFFKIGRYMSPCKNSCQLSIQLKHKCSKKHVVKMLFINSCEIPCLIAFLQLSQVWSKYLSANGLSKHCSNFSNLAKSYGLSGVVQTHPPNNEVITEKIS